MWRLTLDVALRPSTGCTLWDIECTCRVVFQCACACEYSGFLPVDFVINNIPTQYTDTTHKSKPAATFHYAI